MNKIFVACANSRLIVKHTRDTRPVAVPKGTADSSEAEIGGKEWKLAEVTLPPCHFANTHRESAFESGTPRKTKASGSKLYRYLANSLGSGGKVTVEGSSKWRKNHPGCRRSSSRMRCPALMISFITGSPANIPNVFCQLAKS